ncbi:type II toxin-antitoxin system death-on-curing family toxin [Archangium violaceum]|uniref:type II toxin-antitoxin system death-on-curing family toxin n=1 Tax=Archangium violaceum TaxID=83451 RepID=UPI002B30589F|nr:type II toxin-antitoxin system death-on-curing family toxin [Archangium violaceum]
MTPDFLTVEDVLSIHPLQLARYGGGQGVRESGLLESALAQPQASFGGQYVHQDLWEMAAAYLFHVVSNHPFVDGNKRVGLLSALVFLELNGISLTRGSEELYALTMAVAAGQRTKPEVTAALRSIAGVEAPPG